MAIKKKVSVVLTDEEVNSPEDIEIELNVHTEDDPDNEEGVTYTITYTK